MQKIIYLLFLLAICSTASLAQSQSSKNVFAASLSSSQYSLSAERKLAENILSPWLALGPAKSLYSNQMGLEARLFALSGIRKQHLEIGLSFSQFWGNASYRSASSAAVILGYRYQAFDRSGLMVRLGLLPGFSTLEAAHRSDDYLVARGAFDAFIGIGYAF